MSIGFSLSVHYAPPTLRVRLVTSIFTSVEHHPGSVRSFHRLGFWFRLQKITWFPWEESEALLRPLVALTGQTSSEQKQSIFSVISPLRSFLIGDTMKTVKTNFWLCVLHQVNATRPRYNQFELNLFFSPSIPTIHSFIYVVTVFLLNKHVHDFVQTLTWRNAHWQRIIRRNYKCFQLLSAPFSPFRIVIAC